jgi:hypothetical protein
MAQVRTRGDDSNRIGAMESQPLRHPNLHPTPHIPFAPAIQISTNEPQPSANSIPLVSVSEAERIISLRPATREEEEEEGYGIRYSPQVLLPPQEGRMGRGTAGGRPESLYGRPRRRLRR